jgi:predicted RNA binding protein YcfA (HicA-like mRNA interferase family)
LSQFQKFYLKLISGKSDNNIDFNELSNFLTKLGFKERIKGSHHIFTKNGIEEIVNIQPNGKLAKIYQVKQIRKIIIEYKLGGSFE